MLTVIAASVVITGGITGYTVGFNSPLACGYEYVCDGSTPPWAAFPLEWFESGNYQCGDVVLVSVSGKSLLLRALDKCPGCLTFPGGVWDSGLPFVCDLPRYCSWAKGIPTQTGKVMNLSLWRRRHDNIR